MRYSWYVFVCILLYLVFGVIYYFDLPKKRFILLTVSLVIFLLLWMIYKEKTHWYSSLICFWVGVYYSEHLEKDNKNSVARQILSSVAFCTMFCMTMLLYNSLLSNEFGMILLAVMMNMTTTLLALTIFMFYSSKEWHSPLWSFIGGISYEIYLFQGLSMSIVDRLFATGAIFVLVRILLVIVLTIILAMLMNLLRKRGSIKKHA